VVILSERRKSNEKSCIILVFIEDDILMSKLQFRLVKEHKNARIGEIELNGVRLQTPVFMPVGTKATIK
jgi:hypothetical protein